MPFGRRCVGQPYRRFGVLTFYEQNAYTLHPAQRADSRERETIAMSFLQQLKTQARDAQAQQQNQTQQLEANIRTTEQAGQTIAHYFLDVMKQLNVIQPDALALSLDGRTKWPSMKLMDFRYDHRKKTVNDRELTDFLSLSWLILPTVPTRARGKVVVNFPPDLAKVEARLHAGQIKFDRREQRHPDSQKLQSIVFEHDLSARGSVVWTAKHEQSAFHVRLSGVSGLEVRQLQIAARDVTPAKLDELARLIVGQPSTFV